MRKHFQNLWLFIIYVGACATFYDAVIIQMMWTIKNVFAYVIYGKWLLWYYFDVVRVEMGNII